MKGILLTTENRDKILESVPGQLSEERLDTMLRTFDCTIDDSKVTLVFIPDFVPVRVSEANLTWATFPAETIQEYAQVDFEKMKTNFSEILPK